MTEKERKALQRALRDRDGGWVCHWCGRYGNTLDHLVPQSIGGTDELDNLVLACMDCNSRRGNLIPNCTHASCRSAVESQRATNPMLNAVLMALENVASVE